MRSYGGKSASSTELKGIRAMRVTLLQESGVVEFDPRYIDVPPNPPFTLLATSTLPTALISYWAMPGASFDRIAWRSTERWWLTLYGLIAALFFGFSWGASLTGDSEPFTIGALLWSSSGS
jgi:hypothetical protein